MNTFARIDQYWGNVFGLSPGFAQKDAVFVVPHAREWKDNFAFIFTRGNTCAISVRETIVKAVCERANSVSIDELLTQSGVSALFAEPVDRAIGPAFQGYMEAEDFHPFRAEHIRQLNSADNDALQELSKACEPLEWEHSGVKISKLNQFGLFIKDKLVTVAHYDMWASNAASIGAITHPAYRGRGFGKTSASVAIKHAFDCGHLVLYKTLLDNTYSVQLATSLGFREYGRTMAVHLQKIVGK